VAAGTPAEPPPPPPPEFVEFEPEPEPLPPPTPPPTPPPAPSRPTDPTPRVIVAYTSDGRFGLQTTTGNPDDPSDDGKKLTYSEQGITNNTRLFLDGATPLFGSGGRILRGTGPSGPGRIECSWQYSDVVVDQLLEWVHGDLSGRLDTLLVTYSWRNVGTRPRNTGLRVMLDSLIGDNDGVPFIVPGQEGIVLDPQLYRGRQVPDFVRALERADLSNPGVIVDAGLRHPDSESPTEVILTHWPGSDAEWAYDTSAPFGTDTAIGIYYEPRLLAPNAVRSVRFTYGLGTISSTQSRNPSLSLTAGGPFRAGGKFWLVAIVQNPRSGQQVRVELPTGLTLAENETALKTVPESKTFTQVSWLVRIGPSAAGPVQVRATLQPENTSTSCGSQTALYS
jgi:hypothetical protein